MRSALFDHLVEPFESWDALRHALAGAWTAVFDLKSKTAWPYLLSSLLLIVVLHVVQSRRADRGERRSLREWAFPSHVYAHRSAKVDYRFFLLDHTIKFVLYIPVITAIGTGMTRAARQLPTPGLELGWAGKAVVFPVLSLLLADLGIFLAHYLLHRIRFLWFFHEVHHSAEVLTPITVYRVHPVEELVNVSVGGVFTGLAAALYATATGDPVGLPAIFGVNAASLVFYTFAFQLRHSHVWLSYGPVVSRILISPAQHQIHHSRDERHWDKNFGFIFAIWDALLRTLYVPREREVIEFGVPGSDPEDFATVRRLYTRPFRRAIDDLRSRRRAAAATPAATT